MSKTLRSTFMLAFLVLSGGSVAAAQEPDATPDAALAPNAALTEPRASLLHAATPLEDPTLL